MNSSFLIRNVWKTAAYIGAAAFQTPRLYTGKMPGTGGGPPPVLLYWEIQQKDQLSEELEHALRHLVGLGQHGLGGLNQNVVLDVLHHLVGHVCVADGGLSVLDVLSHHGQVVAGVLQTVLDSAQVAADAGHVVDGVLDGLHGGGGVLLVGDVDAVDAHAGGVHVADDYLHLVEGIAGVADLQGQAVGGLLRLGGGGGLHAHGEVVGQILQAGEGLIHRCGVGHALDRQAHHVAVGAVAHADLEGDFGATGGLEVDGAANRVADLGQGGEQIVVGADGDDGGARGAELGGISGGDGAVAHLQHDGLGADGDLSAVLDVGLLDVEHGVGLVHVAQSHTGGLHIGAGVQGGAHGNLVVAAGGIGRSLDYQAAAVAVDLNVDVKVGAGLLLGVRGVHLLEGHCGAGDRGGPLHPVDLNALRANCRPDRLGDVRGNHGGSGAHGGGGGHGDILAADGQGDGEGDAGTTAGAGDVEVQGAQVDGEGGLHSLGSAGHVVQDGLLAGLDAGGLALAQHAGDDPVHAGDIFGGHGGAGLDGVLHGQIAVQQLDAVEVGAVSDTVNFRLQLIDLFLQGGAVNLVVVGAVGGLGGQVVHAVEHVLDLLHGALSGLDQGDAVLDILGGGLQTGDLGAHLLGNGQTGGVVTGAVDLVAGGQLLQVPGQGLGVGVVVAVGVHRHDVVLNPHDSILPYKNYFLCFGLPWPPHAWDESIGVLVIWPDCPKPRYSFIPTGSSAG